MATNTNNTNDNKKDKQAKKKKSNHKMNAKTKNVLVFGSIAIVLIIGTIIFVIATSNNTITYTTSYGTIDTSITINAKDSTAILTVNVDNNKISQICTYEKLDNSDMSENTSNNEDSINGEYIIHLNDVDAKMIISDEELEILYDDGTSIVYKK